MAAEGRRIAEKHNAVTTVTDRFLTTGSASPDPALPRPFPPYLPSLPSFHILSSFSYLSSITSSLTRVFISQPTRPMAFQPPHRDKIPSMKRRCHTHDYRSVSYYMITLGKNPAYTAPFCRIFDAALNPPDFTSARRRSDELTPGIKRILLPATRHVGIKGTAGSSVPVPPPCPYPRHPRCPAVPACGRS